MYDKQRGKEERRRRGSQRETFHVQSARVFFLFTVLASRSCSPPPVSLNCGIKNA